MCVSADVLLVQVKSVMNTRTKYKRGGLAPPLLYFRKIKTGCEPIPCGADEHRCRGLIRDDPAFSAFSGRKCKSSPITGTIKSPEIIRFQDFLWCFRG